MVSDEEPQVAPEREAGRESRGIPTHWKLLIAGVALDIIGSILAFQGIRGLTGSETPALPTWTGAGAICIVLGMVLVILAMRHKAEYG